MGEMIYEECGKVIKESLSDSVFHVGFHWTKFAKFS